MQQARDEIWQSWRYTCAENADHPRARELFDRYKLPAFHDPFAGGGSLPLEAQRLGLEAYASDLNPVAVLINKAMIEIPPKFAGKPPINPESRKDKRLFQKEWRGAQGLAEDVRYYGQWMRDEAEKRIGYLYPKIEITAKMAGERPDLKSLVGQKLTVIAWLWVRTVKSPNPAFAQVDVPLAPKFWLSTQAGKEAYVEPVIEQGTSVPGYRFTVKVGKPKDAEAAKNGTKLARGANFKCLMSGVPIAGDYIKAEGKAGRMGARLMAIVAESERGRIYLPPTEMMEAAAHKTKPKWRPEGSFVEDARAFTPCLYGLNEWQKLFTDRQLVALTTLSDLVTEAHEYIQRDALTIGLPNDYKPLRDDGTGATAYADAVGVYLGIALSRLTDICNALCRWEITRTQVRNLFGRQAIPMLWDFAENNLFGKAAGDYFVSLSTMTHALEQLPAHDLGIAHQDDAQNQSVSSGKIVSTDPPYYDNIPYADLSDFFYVWLRHSLKPILPDLFATLVVPKTEELVAVSYRHDGKAGAEAFFLDGMTQAMQRLADQAHPAFPVTIYYAFKQTETSSEHQEAGNDVDFPPASRSLLPAVISTGWEIFLDAVIRAGFAITGTWPIRTELDNRMRSMNSSTLASSIILVCRARAADAAHRHAPRVRGRPQGRAAGRACSPTAR